MGQSLEIRVQDDGEGITADLLPHVFDMFGQEQSGYSGGLGLGLSLVQRLVEMHEGTVEAHSEGPGRGSEFVVRLPLRIEKQASAPSEAVPEAGASVAPARKQAGLRIAVVDDSDDMREAMQELLTLLGHEVQVADERRCGRRSDREQRNPTSRSSTSACRSRTVSRWRDACAPRSGTTRSASSQ